MKIMVDSLLAVAIRGKVGEEKKKAKYFARGFQVCMDFSVAFLQYQQEF